MIKTVIRIWTIDNFDEEERWLNEMSAKGKILVRPGFCNYTFEDGQPNKYQYKLLFLPECINSKKSQDYLDFLKETGIEYMGRCFRWVYLRKETSSGDFEIFSDIQSELSHFKRIQSFMLAILILEIIALAIGFVSFIGSNFINLMPFLLNVGATAFIACLYKWFKAKIAKLEAQQGLYE